jgi:hypothetical protein
MLSSSMGIVPFKSCEDGGVEQAIKAKIGIRAIILPFFLLLCTFSGSFYIIPYDKPIKPGFQDFFLLKGENLIFTYAASSNRWDV